VWIRDGRAMFTVSCLPICHDFNETLLAIWGCECELMRLDVEIIVYWISNLTIRSPELFLNAYAYAIVEIIQWYEGRENQFSANRVWNQCT